MTTDQALDLPAVEYAGRSDPGRDPSKQVNEDAGGHRETRLGHLVVVCDGMGGHASGREAAELALSTIFEMFDQAPDGVQPGAVLRGAIEEASRRVYAMPTTEAGGRPGSTVVGILLHPYGTEVAHVGDSRVYLVHEGQIARVTRDHSIVQEMVDRGLLTLEQAASHPDANRITRALGMAPEVEVELRPVPVHHVTGDAFVLCSDGLSDLVADAEILQTVASEPAAQAVGKLVDLANARGGHDNITVLVLRPRTTALEGQVGQQQRGDGVAPTIAQTRVPEPQTLVDPPFDRPLDEAPRTEMMPARAIPVTPAPPPLDAFPSGAGAGADHGGMYGPQGPRPAALTPPVIAALVAGGVVIAAASAFIALRVAAHARATPSPELDAQATAAEAPAASSDASRPAAPPTPLVPGSVDTSAAAVPPAEPLAPLEPAEATPDAHHPPRKKKKQ